jgi:hypothetical protein
MPEWLKTMSSCTQTIVADSLRACVAPAVGFEPTTNRLTADRSTTELRWIAGAYISCTDSLEATANRLIPILSGLYH